MKTKSCSNKSLPISYCFSVISRQIQKSESTFCFEIKKKKKKRNYEVYAQYLHFLFNPFQTELDLKIENSCTKKLEAPDVIDIVNRNRSIIEPYCELFDEVMLSCNSEVINNDQALKKISFYVLDNSSTENKSVGCMNQGDIID